MNSAIATIQEKAQRLSPQKQAEVVHFIDTLLQAEAPVMVGETRGFKFDWIVDPDEPPEPLDSVALQHQATEWIVEMAEKHLEKK